MTHELKILPEWYENLASGIKSFEVRKDDRTPRFEPKDELFLREFDGNKYTGRTMRADVRFVLRGEYCKDGYCIMSVTVKSKYPDTPMTNYERIKNMSVEEMVEIINVLTRCCNTDECHECPIVSMLGFLTDYLSMLEYSRMKQLKDWQYFVSPPKERESNE